MLSAFIEQDIGFKRGSNSMVVWGGYLYQFGGVSTVAVATDRFILSSKILPDGSLAPATQPYALSSVRNGNAMIHFGQYVFILGGSTTGAGSNLISRYKLESNGQVSGGVDMLLPTTYTGGTTCQHIPIIGNIAYIWRGFAGNQLVAATVTVDGLQKMQVVAESPADVPTLGSVCLLAHGNVLLAIGGTVGVTFQKNIYAATVQGYTVGPWRLVGTLPEAVRSGMGAIIDGRLVWAGGRPGNAPTAASGFVYVAGLDVEGNITTPFRTVGGLAVAAYGQAVAVTPTHVYFAAGVDADLGNISTVQYAKIVRGP